MEDIEVDLVEDIEETEEVDIVDGQAVEVDIDQDDLHHTNQMVDTVKSHNEKDQVEVAKDSVVEIVEADIEEMVEDIEVKEMEKREDTKDNDK